MRSERKAAEVVLACSFATYCAAHGGGESLELLGNIRALLVNVMPIPHGAQIIEKSQSEQVFVASRVLADNLQGVQSMGCVRGKVHDYRCAHLLRPRKSTA